MNKLTKIFALVLVCVMMVAGAVIPANATLYTAEAGKTVETSFKVLGTYGAEGGISFDNLDMFSEVKVTKRVITEDAEINGSFVCTTDVADIIKNGNKAFTNTTSAVTGYPDAKIGVFLYAFEAPVDFEVVLTCTLKADVDPDAVCNVTFKRVDTINDAGDKAASVTTDVNTIHVATADDLIIGTQKRYSGDNREIRLVVKMTGTYQEIMDLEKITVHLTIDGVETIVDLDGVYQQIENDGVYVSAAQYHCTRFALCYIGKIKDVESISAYATKTDSEGNVVSGMIKNLDLTKLRA